MIFPDVKTPVTNFVQETPRLTRFCQRNTRTYPILSIAQNKTRWLEEPLQRVKQQAHAIFPRTLAQLVKRAWLREVYLVLALTRSLSLIVDLDVLKSCCTGRFPLTLNPSCLSLFSRVTNIILFSSRRCVSDHQPKSHPSRTIVRPEEVALLAFRSSLLVAISITTKVC